MQPTTEQQTTSNPLAEQLKQYLNDCPYTREQPSSRYTELLSLYQHLHLNGDENRPPEKYFAGQCTELYLQEMRDLFVANQVKTVLDYGSGKGLQYAKKIKVNTVERGLLELSIAEILDVDSIQCYDPGYPMYANLPNEQFDGIICTDVIEHLPEEDIPWLMREIFQFARKAVFINIACYSAKKSLPNGENAHCMVREPHWWKHFFYQFKQTFPTIDYRIALTFISDNKIKKMILSPDDPAPA